MTDMFEFCDELEWLCKQIFPEVKKIDFHLANNYFATAAYVTLRSGDQFMVSLAELSNEYVVMWLLHQIMKHLAQYEPKHAKKGEPDALLEE